MGSSEQLFKSVHKEGAAFRAASKHDQRGAKRHARTAQREQSAMNKAKRAILLPQIDQELARIKNELDAIGWQSCVQLKILRCAFGSFGKKLGAFKLSDSPGGRLMPWYFATDGQLYTYMRSDAAQGYGRIRLRHESAYYLEGVLKILRDTTIS